MIRILPGVVEDINLHVHEVVLKLLPWLHWPSPKIGTKQLLISFNFQIVLRTSDLKKIYNSKYLMIVNSRKFIDI